MNKWEYVKWFVLITVVIIAINFYIKNRNQEQFYEKELHIQREMLRDSIEMLQSKYEENQIVIDSIKTQIEIKEHQDSLQRKQVDRKIGGFEKQLHDANNINNTNIDSMLQIIWSE